MQVLQPLAVGHVGLAAGHVLHVPGIDQADLDAGFLEQLGQGYPVNAGRFHRHRGDVVLLEPGDELAQVFGEGVEAAHRRVGDVGGHGDIDLARADVGAGGVEVEHGLHPHGFGFARLGHRRRVVTSPQGGPLARRTIRTLSNGMLPPDFDSWAGLTTGLDARQGHHARNRARPKPQHQG